MERFFEEEFDDWEQELGNLQVRCWGLQVSLADAMDERVRQGKLEIKPHQYEVAADAAADLEAPEDKNSYTAVEC